MEITIYTPLYYVKMTGGQAESFAQNMNFSTNWNLIQEPYRTLTAFLNIEGLKDYELTASSLRASMDNVWLVCPGSPRNPKKYFEVLKQYYFNKEDGIDAAFDYVFGCDSEEVFLAYEYGEPLEVYTQFWSSLLNEGIIGDKIISEIQIRDNHRSLMAYYTEIGKSLAWQTDQDVKTCQELALMGFLSFSGNKFIPIVSKVLPTYTRIK